MDLLVLAIWLDVDDEAYGKVVGVAFVWSFYALIALGLTLAVRAPQRIAKPIYLGAVTVAVGAGLISAYLVVTAGDSEVVADEVTDRGPIDVVPYAAVGDDDLLRALGAALVLLAGPLVRRARGQPNRRACGRGHTLNRTFRTSPSSTT